MEYDIELVVNLCSIPPFDARIDRFFERGILNIGDRKVLLRLLVGPQKINVPTLRNVSVIQETHPVDDVTVKTYHHFGNRKPSTARWIAKFDDDTNTDVDGLLTKLDRFYDWQVPIYLTTNGIRSDIARLDRINLVESGFGDWLQEGIKLLHEIEGCVLSATLMDRILGIESIVRLLKNRSRQPARKGSPNWNDQTLGFAASFAGVPPSECSFMSHNADIHNFSLLRGRFVHIHNTTPDKDEFITTVLDRLLDGDVSSDLVGSYALIDSKGSTSAMIFEPGGTINGNAGAGRRFHSGVYIDLAPDKLFVMRHGSKPMTFVDISGSWHCGDFTLRKFLT